MTSDQPNSEPAKKAKADYSKFSALIKEGMWARYELQTETLTDNMQAIAALSQAKFWFISNNYSYMLAKLESISAKFINNAYIQFLFAIAHLGTQNPELAAELSLNRVWMSKNKGVVVDALNKFHRFACNIVEEKKLISEQLLKHKASIPSLDKLHHIDVSHRVFQALQDSEVRKMVDELFERANEYLDKAFEADADEMQDRTITKSLAR